MNYSYQSISIIPQESDASGKYGLGFGLGFSYSDDAGVTGSGSYSCTLKSADELKKALDNMLSGKWPL